MEIRDINKTIEVATLKKRKRRCKIMGLVWFGTSAITAGVLAPILLAQPNNNTSNNNTNTGTGTGGTGTPTNNLKTGYVYGGHIYDSEDKAKAALLATKTGNKPGNMGSLQYSINGIPDPLDPTNAAKKLTLKYDFNGATPNSAELLAAVNPHVESTKYKIVRANEKETIVSFHASSSQLTKIKTQLHLTAEPFIKFSLTPSNDPSDYVDTITNLHLGKYSDDLGYIFGSTKIQGWTKSSWTSTGAFPAGDAHWQSPDTLSTFWKGDSPFPDTPMYLNNAASGDKQGRLMRTFPRFGSAENTIATTAIRFKASIQMPSDPSNPNSAKVWTTHSQDAPATGPAVYIYTNLPDSAWETKIDGFPLRQYFIVHNKNSGDAAGQPATEVARIYDVLSGDNKPLGQIRVDESAPSTPGAIPTYTAANIAIDNSSIVVASAERPWEITDLTTAELANITVVPNVEFTNGETWPKP